MHSSSPNNPDPVIELDNAIAGARLLADEVGGPPPLIQGRYELRAILGRGAHGLVCEASDRHLRREVALKLLPLRRPRAIEYAVREAQTLAQFDHPNIVRIFDVGQASEVADLRVELVFVVMELIKGTNLRRWVSEGQELAVVREVFIAAGEGLAAAHEQGFIHGDFKPENVVLDGRGQVRVVDFGLARWGSGEVAEEGPLGAVGPLTQGPRGTPGYIAPEVHTSRIDARSDQFSFAVSLCEAMSGRRPEELARNATIQGGSSWGTLSLPLARLLVRASAEDPDARYPSMRELLAELRRIDLRPPTFPLSPTPSPSWWARPGLLFSGGVVGLVVFSLFLSQGEPAAGPRRPEDPPRVNTPPPVTSQTPERAAAPRVSTSPPATSKTPERAAAPRVSTPPPATSKTPEPTCSELDGSWKFTTSVQWAAEDRFVGEHGFYWLEVEPGSDCRAVFRVRKHGDSSLPNYRNIWQDRVEATLAQADSGELAVTLDTWLGKNRPLDGSDSHRDGLHYVYSLRWKGAQLEGEFQMFDRSTGEPAMRGTLTGSRG